MRKSTVQFMRSPQKFARDKVILVTNFTRVGSRAAADSLEPYPKVAT